MRVVPFESLDEGIGHSFRFGVVIGGREDQQADHPGDPVHLASNLCRSVVSQPLNLHKEPVQDTEADLNHLGHQIPDHVSANASRCDHVANDLPITSIRAKCNPDLLPRGNCLTISIPVTFSRLSGVRSTLGLLQRE